MAVVQFDVTEFRAIYPEFADATQYPDARLEFMFNQAELIVNNTDNSVIKDVKQRKTLLYTLVAHQSALSSGSSNGGASGAVTSATEGSVSISFDSSGINSQNAWFMKTQYGQLFWQLTLNYRTMRYIPGVARPSKAATNGWWWRRIR